MTRDAQMASGFSYYLFNIDCCQIIRKRIGYIGWEINSLTTYSSKLVNIEPMEQATLMIGILYKNTGKSLEEWV